MFTGDTTWWFVFFPLFPTILMLSLTFYYIWIRPSCCPYLERREAEKYLESMTETASDNQTYTNTHAIGILPGSAFLALESKPNANLSAPGQSDQRECIAQQQVEGSFLEYDDSVTIANNQFNADSNHDLAVGSVATKSDKQSRRMSQLPIA